MDSTLFALAPLITVGGPITSWIATFVLIAVVITFIIWIVTKFAGPPKVPETYGWIVWLIVVIALLFFLFSALGIRLP